MENCNESKAIFVFGNRYAPDCYEGIVPDEMLPEVDLLARSGMIGLVNTKNPIRKDPTRIKLLGYVCCRTLHAMGHKVRAAKVTGTASLKGILHMNDAGAHTYADLTHLGFPSTCRLSCEDTLHIFNALDLKYANNPRNFWVGEFADGIIQRETAMLLASPEVTSRIDKFIFCAGDTFGVIGGLTILKERFGLEPDAISGICSSSPLHVRELSDFTDIPVFNSLNDNNKQLGLISLGG